MNKFHLITILYIFFLYPSVSQAGSVLELFDVSTEGAIAYEFTESSIQLESKKHSYLIKLEPNQNGTVVFSLSSYGYASTVRVNNLAFGVEVLGYRGEKIIQPAINIDAVNSEVEVFQNFIRFKHIDGSIPIFFNEQVDSIKLQFSNSAGIDILQYLSIKDLKIVGGFEAVANPVLQDCDSNTIMIGLEGSASIDKKERATISKNLINFVKDPSLEADSNTVCLMEFSSKVHAVYESTVKKELVKAIKSYKKHKNHGKKKKSRSWSDWNAAFDKAIERKPNLFIFVADSWSNCSGGNVSSFSAQFEKLIEKCNKLKENGTRLLFITSGLNGVDGSVESIYPLLNQSSTVVVSSAEISPDTDLKSVDLITIEDLLTFEQIPLKSMFKCPNETDSEVAMKGE